MTIAGKTVNTEPLKLWALHSQRLVVIVGLLAFLWRQPDHVTGWSLLSAAVVDLFHAAKNGNTNGATK